jgi:hypothetical protein
MSAECSMAAVSKKTPTAAPFAAVIDGTRWSVSVGMSARGVLELHEKLAAPGPALELHVLRDETMGVSIA